MPLKVRVSEISNSSVMLSWSKPAEPKGEIQGYRLYYMKNNNFTDVVTVRETADSIQHVIQNLGTYVIYKYSGSSAFYHINFSGKNVKYVKSLLSGYFIMNDVKLSL
jgi:hypothetical protein